MLEVGTGSGYQAAVLSRLARDVVSVERYRTLAETARERLKTLGFAMSRSLPAMGSPAFRRKRRSTASSSPRRPKSCPQALVAQLAEGGKMVLPLGPHDGTQHLVKLTKTAQGLPRENLIAVRFVPLLPGQAREL